MSPDETRIHSFILKLWLETSPEETRRRWRGYITHVPSGERRYVQTLAQVNDFVESYLDELGVTPNFRRRVRLRWNRLARPTINRVRQWLNSMSGQKSDSA